MTPFDANGAKSCRTCLWLRLSALIIWTAGITLLSLISISSIPAGLLGWDKLQHALAYGLLTFLLMRFLVQWGRPQQYMALISWAVVVCFGLLMEVLQYLGKMGRTAEPADILADALGAMLACVLFRHTFLRRWCQPEGISSQ